MGKASKAHQPDSEDYTTEVGPCSLYPRNQRAKVNECNPLTVNECNPLTVKVTNYHHQSSKKISGTNILSFNRVLNLSQNRKTEVRFNFFSHIN